MARLFLVEDHPIMRQTLVTLLEREKDLVVCGEAETGEEALQKLGEVAANLVLIDMSLPGMDGLMLLTEVRARWPQLPCLVLSGYDEPVYVNQVLAAGAAGYVPKHRVHGIVPAVRRALEGNHRSN
jgi:DNA-binding NarL/FixJ family response regulator